MNETNKEIVDNLIKLLDNVLLLSILFPDYTTIWVAKNNKGSYKYSEDKKAWDIDMSKEELINLIKNKLGI